MKITHTSGSDPWRTKKYTLATVPRIDELIEFGATEARHRLRTYGKSPLFAYFVADGGVGVGAVMFSMNYNEFMEKISERDRVFDSMRHVCRIMGICRFMMSSEMWMRRESLGPVDWGGHKGTRESVMVSAESTTAVVRKAWDIIRDNDGNPDMVMEAHDVNGMTGRFCNVLFRPPALPDNAVADKIAEEVALRAELDPA